MMGWQGAAAFGRGVHRKTIQVVIVSVSFHPDGPLIITEPGDGWGDEDY